MMKETLESVDKLQIDLDQANTSKLALENRAKAAEDQVAMLQRQVQELQSQVEENWATSTRIIELEAELQETLAWGGEIFVEGQDLVKKELVKWFPSEEFSKTDNIFLEEEGDNDEQDEEEQVEDNPTDWVSTDNVIDVENTDIIET